MTMCRWHGMRTIIQGLIAVWISLIATVAAAGSAPQILDLTYQPAPFHVGSGIEVQPRLLKGEEKGTVFRCRWFVNEEEIDDISDTRLPGDRFQRGDLVAVEVTPERGERRGAPVRSGSVEAGNTPPRIVSQPPQGFSSGLFSYAIEAVDADDDSLDFFLRKGPAGMQVDSESGLLIWPVEEWREGQISVVVAVEDGFGGEDVQQFTMNMSFVKIEGQNNE